MPLTDKEHEALTKIKEFEDTVPKENWNIGWSWDQVGVYTATINNLMIKGFVENTYSSHRFKHYVLTDAGKQDIESEITAYANPQSNIELNFDNAFLNIVGHEDIKELLSASLQLDKPLHILLHGPPAIAKTLFLWELERICGEQALWMMGSGVSKAGMWEMIAQRKPKVLLVDELEKMKTEDMVGLLGLMEKGRITKMKKGSNMDIVLKTWVIATANRIDRLPSELKSRFALLGLKEYSAKEFIRVVQSTLQSSENLTSDNAFAVATKLTGRTHDVRDAIRVARLSKSIGVDRAVELLFK